MWFVRRHIYIYIICTQSHTYRFSVIGDFMLVNQMLLANGVNVWQDSKQVYMHMCMHVCTYVRMYAIKKTGTGESVGLSTEFEAAIYVCTYARVYVCMHIYIYIYLCMYAHLFVAEMTGIYMYIHVFISA